MKKESLYELIERREGLTARLVQSLAHLPIARQISIVSSFIPLDELEEIVIFEEAHT